MNPRSFQLLFQALRDLGLSVIADIQGQDLIEYALMAGFVAVAAGVVMPGVATSISKVFSHVSSVLAVAASQS
jgi:Flp pilus assembly pilin Flp